MSYIKLLFDLPLYILFSKNCSNKAIEYICKKLNKELNDGKVENPTITVLYSNTLTDCWFPPQSSFLFNTFETNKLCFKITYQYYPKLLPKLIINCIAASLIHRKDYLLVHGILLNNGEVIYGLPYSGKTTLVKQLSKDMKALCDDNVIIDLEKKLAYPLPYFYIDSSSIFNNIPIDIKPYSLNNIKPINDKQNIFKCSTMFLSQPFALREEVFTCDDNLKWSSFQKSFKDKVEQRIQYLIEKYEL